MSDETGGGGTSIRTKSGRHGAVAGTIHGGVHNSYYQIPPGASPTQKFRIALRYLASGQATTARKLLDEVTIQLRRSNEVWFYWLLAFYSGRTLSELDREERERLKATLQRIDGIAKDRWSPGIQVIRRLDAADGAPSGAAESELRLDIDNLGATMRTEVLRHLERILQGRLKDDLWDRDVDQARAYQKADRRQDRVWKFFEPDPAAPRTLPVRRSDIPTATVAFAAGLGAVAAAAAGLLGWLAIQRDDASALAGLVVALVAGGVGLSNLVEWRYRAEGLRDETRRLRARRFSRAATRPGGFTRQVDHLYARYANRYAPEGSNRDDWLVDAYVPMSRLRDEVCEVYREQRVEAEAVKWLIRFQVRELRRNWDTGTLTDHRRRWRVPGPVRAGATLGALVAVAGVAWAVQAAARQNLLQTAGAVVTLAAAGWIAAFFGLRIGAEKRRVTIEVEERRQRETSYWFEYQRWQHRLSDRPDDMMMGQWLDCDRRILLDRTLAAYQLKWSDISAYASMEARGEDSRQARAKNGPWRYSRYTLLVFLLTADGVRQITVELDFGPASFHHWERTNYRYDAVAAVRLTLRDDGTREFQLFLVNGTAIEVAVTEPGRAGADEDDSILDDGAQDSTGVRNTLFVLEGVAAEGRSWWAGPAYRRAG